MKKINVLLITLLLCVSAGTGFAQVSRDFPSSETYVDVVVDSATLQTLSHNFSVDRVRRNADHTFDTRVWLPYHDYDNFLALGIPYTVVEPTRATVTMAQNYAQMVSGWNRYPTYNTYLAMMDTFQTRYPNLCKIDTLLASTEGGHKILCAHISNNLNDNMGKPSVFYTSTMHGDEVMGYYFMLRLIDMLLSNYGTDTRLTNMVNNFDIWICPLHNPDGTYYGSNNQINNTSTYSRRGNYRNLDLNRNFPQPNQSIGSSTYYEQNHLMEVWAMMQFLGAHNFTLAANFHGGAEVFNYPWDAWVTSEHAHADDAWWQYVGRKFADTCQHYNSNYFTEENNGITEGGDWYVIDGSMQDYHNWFLGTRHVTIEVGEKVLSTSLLPTYWNYVYHSLLNFIEEADNGIHGIVTDSVSGAPLQAMVYVENHDADHSYVETNMPYGDYHRPIKAGTYSVTYSAEGYYPKTIVTNVTDGAKLVQNVQLVNINYVPATCEKPVDVTASNVAGTTASLSWTETGTASEWVLQYGTDEDFDEGTYTELDVNGTAGADLAGLTAETQYYARVKAVCDADNESEWSAVCTFLASNYVVIGSCSGTSNNLPTNNAYKYSLTQQIYTVEELGEAGRIMSIAFYKNNTTLCNRKLDVYMVSTDKSGFSGKTDWIPITAADKVFSGTVNFSHNEWTTIVLNRSFAYDGEQNVAIIVDDNTGSYKRSTSFCTFPASNQALRIYSDGTDYNLLSASNYSGTVESMKNYVRMFVDRSGSCLAPTDIAVTGVDHQSAMLSWNGEAESWVVSYKPSTASQFTEVSMTENGYTMTNLETETEYTVNVAAICGTDTVWGEEITFTTLSEPCPAISLDTESGRWEEDFENVTIADDGRLVPSCWTLPEVYENSIAKKNKPQLHSGYATSGSYSLKMRDLCVYAMPEYDMSVTPIQDLEMTFNLRQANSAYQLEVGVMTDANDPGTFVPVQLIDNATTGIEEVTVSFANYVTPANANQFYIAFRNKGRTSAWTYSYNYIDDIVLKARTGCGITSLPYKESFESCVSAEDGRLVPSCWTLPAVYDTTIATKNKPQQHASFATDGNYSLKMRDLCVYAMPEYAVSGTPIQNVTMTFTLRQANKNYRLEVGVMTDANDPSTFELVQLINNSSTGIETVEVSFADYVAPTDAEQLFIAFRNVGSSSAWTYSYNYIDSLVIAETVTKIAESPKVEMFEEEAMEADRYLENIKVYPNPTRDYVNVQCTMDNVQCKGVEVFDVYGKVVRNVVGANDYSPLQTRIDVSGLAAGMYFVRVTTDKGTVTKPFVKR